MPRTSIEVVERCVRMLCAANDGMLPFHGWHHVEFVRGRAIEFAGRNGADVDLVEVAALLHDVNYLVERNSDAAAGDRLRAGILVEAGISSRTAEIAAVIADAEMRDRRRDISAAAQALSDADTLFKALPITPIMLAHRYLDENGVTLRELAEKIADEQSGVQEQGFYFYDSEAAATYGPWAQANLALWRCVRESLEHSSVAALLAAVAPAAAERGTAVSRA